jgi:hypothetical protein
VQRIAVGCGQSIAPRLCSTHRHWHTTNLLRHRLGQAPLSYHWRAERHPARRALILTYWTRVHRRTLLRWLGFTITPWLHGTWYADAMCVHGKEGAWDANTGNGYYGGMQFSLSTWASNGGSGRPDLVTPAEQLRIAYLTWQRRGWSPWPSTAAACGLL